MIDVNDEVRRSLEVLWGIESPPRRGRKPRVTSGTVVAAGVAIADRDGLDAVSIRNVAQEVGVTAMAIYSYVPTKSVLVDAMLDQVLADLTDEDPPSGRWREQLAWSARRTWMLYQEHPWALSITTVRRPFGPNLLAALEANLQIVSQLGLEAEEMVRVIDTVDAYVHGALAATLSTTRSETDSDISNREWFQRHGDLLDQFADFDDYPILASLWDAGQLSEHRLDFEFGLHRVLDGLAHYVSTRPTATGAAPARAPHPGER